MIARILRPRFWALRRKLCGLSAGSRVAVAGLLAVLAAGGAWGYPKLVSLLGGERGTVLAGTMLSLVVPLFVMLVLLSLTDLLQRLYLSSDLELLMVAPLPLHHVFAAKLLECTSLWSYLALVLLVPLTALGDAQQAGFLYYPLGVILVAVVAVLISAFGMVLVMLVVRVIPPQRLKDWIPPAFLLLAVPVLLLQQKLMGWLAGWEGWAWLVEAMLDIPRLAVVVAAVAGVAAASVLVALAVFKNAFYVGWSGFREAPVRRATGARGRRRARSPLAEGRALPPHARALLSKEWRCLRRDPNGLIALLMTPLMSAVLLLLCTSGESASGPLIFWSLLLLPAAYGGFYVGAGPALSSLGEEGRNLALLLGSPVQVRTVLLTKCFAACAPSCLLWALVAIVIGSFASLPVWQIALLIAGTTWGLVGGSAAATGIGALAADPSADDPARSVSSLARFASLGLAAAFMVTSAAGVARSVIRLFPGSDLLPLSHAALAQLPLVGWLFGESTLPGWALAGSQVLLWAVVLRLWAAGVRRVEWWEPA
jgi:hypothetical protein